VRHMRIGVGGEIQVRGQLGAPQRHVPDDSTDEIELVTALAKTTRQRHRRGIIGEQRRSVHDWIVTLGAITPPG
jgi:hypothetical protein